MGIKYNGRLKLTGASKVAKTPSTEPSLPPDFSAVAEEQKIQASDIQAGDQFGWSADISGNTCIVGAVGEDSQGENSGAAYILVRSGSNWIEQQKLIANDAETGDRLGHSVAIDGNTCIVGADGKVGGGAAYIFTRSGNSWTQQQKLVSRDGNAGDLFGWAVSLDGDTCAIGARGEDIKGSGSGSVYVFTRTNGVWTEQQILQASNGGGGDAFGYSVSISGDTFVSSAPYEDTVGGNAGSAYIFTRSGNTWTEQQKIQSNDIQSSDQFGFSVAISGDTCIVGATFEDTGGSAAGSAYVFMRTDDVWTDQQRLQGSDKQSGDYFGCSVSIEGDTCVVGAYGEDTGGSQAGATYVYTRNGTFWSEAQKFVALDAQAGDSFGYSSAISGSSFISGTYHNNTSGTDAGAAYIYTAK